MKSVMTTQEQFSRNEGANIPRSSFDRSFGHKTTIDAGKLYPIFCDEALPGDTFQVDPTIFARFATPLKPIMDNVFVDIHFFSVPMRLLWANTKRFFGEQTDPDDSIDYTIPSMMSPEGGYDELSLYDYFGLPTKVGNFPHNSLPLRAYNLIYNEWYRDENLQDSLSVPTGDSGDTTSQYIIRPRNKRKDYFTSALPWAQKGDPVSIPLANNIDVTSKPGGNDAVGFPRNVAAGFKGWDPTSDRVNATDGYLTTAAGIDNTDILGVGTSPSVVNPANLHWGDDTGLEVLLSEATAITINNFREAVTLQQFLETDARGGTRYTELIKSHFNVTSPDSRLQRPEYLGGGSTSIDFNTVPQNSASADEQTPQGNLAAFGTAMMSKRGFYKTFTEHEYVIGLVSIRADLTYQSGLEKLWSRESRYDFFWPAFANLGEQAILNKEIYVQGNSADDEAFGYQERYSEYKYKPSQITGLFRSNAAQSLDIWHLSQDFDSLPALNASFINENPPIDRVVAVPSEPTLIIDSYFKFKAIRPMPTFATPGLRRL